jgi:hypothetical protein
MIADVIDAILPRSNVMNECDEHDEKAISRAIVLKKLDLEQVRRIDEMLDSLGDYGELHLIIQHGELRYINRVESVKAWKTNGDGRRPDEVRPVRRLENG